MTRNVQLIRMCLQKEFTEDMYRGGLDQSRFYMDELVHLQEDLEWLRREVEHSERILEQMQVGTPVSHR